MRANVKVQSQVKGAEQEVGLKQLVKLQIYFLS